MRSAGDVLRARRAFHGLSQVELAQKAGTTQSQISRIERGTISPTFSTLVRLLAAMGDTMEIVPRSAGQVIKGKGERTIDPRSFLYPTRAVD